MSERREEPPSRWRGNATATIGCEYQLKRDTCRDLDFPVTVVATGTRDPACVSGRGKDQVEYGGMVTERRLFQTPTQTPVHPQGRITY